MPIPKTMKNPSTQEHLLIAEIKDNVAVLKDGSLLAVLLVPSINFYLKSEEEQNALIAGYVQLLNSIDFPIQIVVQSRKLSIENYLGMIREAERTQTNELLKIQTADYRDFVKELVDLADIMSKRFYVVVPYAPLKAGKKSFFNKISEAIYPASKVVLKEAQFVKYREELSRRVDTVISGLASMSLNAAPLDTQALVELYYTYYNPTTGDKQLLTNVGELQVDETS